MRYPAHRSGDGEQAETGSRRQGVSPRVIASSAKSMLGGSPAHPRPRFAASQARRPARYAQASACPRVAIGIERVAKSGQPVSGRKPALDRGIGTHVDRLDEERFQRCAGAAMFRPRQGRQSGKDAGGYSGARRRCDAHRERRRIEFMIGEEGQSLPDQFLAFGVEAPRRGKPLMDRARPDRAERRCHRRNAYRAFVHQLRGRPAKERTCVSGQCGERPKGSPPPGTSGNTTASGCSHSSAATSSSRMRAARAVAGWPR